jgi:hypothetical protein
MGDVLSGSGFLPGDIGSPITARVTNGCGPPAGGRNDRGQALTRTLEIESEKVRIPPSPTVVAMAPALIAKFAAVCRRSWGVMYGKSGSLGIDRRAAPEMGIAVTEQDRILGLSQTRAS